MITVNAERRSALHFRCTQVGPHNAGSEAAPLAAGETACSIQADTLGVQVVAGLTPMYLSEECQLATVGGRRELRSADVITCHVPRTQTKLGDRAFQVAGPRLWNSLPPSMR